MLNIPVILGSVREGRKSEAPARYILEKLKAAGVQTQLVDFKELQLPFVNCPLEPSEYNKAYPHETVNTWSKIADAADGFVFIIPEYNHGYSAVLKNAMDWLYPEFVKKAAGLVGVSSGKISGARAVEQFRTICGNFSMYDVRETVMFGPIKDAFDEQGNLKETKYEKQVDGLLFTLLAAAQAMKELRIEKKI